ncbi:hypothetical protein QBC46DRAFT_462469 [Diplogelasinospora grovesii]|uniref:Polyketide synthase n=1 Tax=Diplogelasinospora grovesii TaxID=303347 RepID=A0AAN6MXK7_9PEZI|nr:hypothetical protein QBC46DRAFT_462469 [Diplogelasinospora grovesii]
MDTESQIAVIGMACRLPGGAANPEGLWSMLAEGRDGWTEVPKDRWDWKSFYHKDPETKEAMNFSHGYFLDQDIAAFDARFFGIPAAEATGVDPQQRLLLEITYEALENAGVPIESLRGSDTSVHMAMFARDYDRMGYKDGPQIHKAHILGSGDAILSNRISYIFDLKGSSNTLDTGCSGSLVALHQACRTLRANESSLAIAGASQLLLTPDQSIAMTSVGTLINKDGRCYTFDDRGAGYGRGEGLGVLVLKRLDRALADGDAIHAVVVNSGVNHDGKTAGIFLPNADAQERLARSVYAKAGLDPRETLYVEAHGTGTVAGDQAEIQSISNVFGRAAGRTPELPVGSIKSNIGHLESSSGVAGILKAILVLKKNQIPPNLNFINPKPALHLEERGIKVPLELMPLTPEGYAGPRRVSVNSFGYGGANAHAILEAYDRRLSTASHLANGNGHEYHSNGIVTNGNANDIVNGAEKHHDAETTSLVVLSANSEMSLGKVISNLQEWLASDHGRSVPFADLAYTLNVRRSKLPWRCSVLARNTQELATALADPKLVRPVKAAREVGMAFVFTGQGAQWFAMGRELLTSSRAFAGSIALCSRTLQDLGCDWDLAEELSRSEKTSRLGESRFSQPCTTAVQIALVDLLESFGIRPQSVCGHSSGEIAAAYAAGALSEQAAMRVAYHRGICSSMAKGLNATQGAMLAVGEGEEAIAARIQGLSRGKVTVACVNSPESTTISGDLAAIEELQAALDDATVFHRRLKVDSAYHSHHMAAVAQSYLSSLDGMAHGMPRKDVAFCSSVTGKRKLADFGPSYWVSNLVSQVKFSAASRLAAEHLGLASAGANVLVEVGPHSALSGPLRQSLSGGVSDGSLKYTYVPCLVRKQSAVDTILTLVGKTFEAGYAAELEAVMNDQHGNAGPCRVVDSLPTYPWDHSTTYWHESRLSKGHRLRPFPYHDLVGLVDTFSTTHEPRWRFHVSLQSLPWLQDHVVEGFVIFPGAGYLTMVMEAMKQLFQLRQTPGHIKRIHFRDIAFRKSVVISGSKDDVGYRNYVPEVELQLTLSPARQYEGSPWEYFRVLSYDAQNGSWTEHSTGLVTIEAESDEPQLDEVEGTREDDLSTAAAAEMLQDIQANSPIAIEPARLYDDLAASGNAFGPSFRGIKEIHVGKCCGLARVVVEDVVQIMPGQYMQPHIIHPATFDAVNQLQAAVFRGECVVAPVMPVLLGELSISTDIDATAGAEFLVALHLTPEGPRAALGNSCAYQKQRDGTLRPVLTASRIRLQVTSYRMEWQPDVDYLTQTQFMNHVSRRKLLDVGYGTLSKLVAEEQLLLNEQVATIQIRRALGQLREKNISVACTPHLSKLLNWMLEWSQSEAAGRLLEGTSGEDEEDKLVEQASNDNIVGFTLSRFGPRLFDLFTGRADALELLIQDDLLGRLYSEYTLFNCHYAQVAEYMQALVHKKPNMKILEIGAGTGSASMPVMESINRNGRLLAEEYTYTDISSGFFERARNKFGQWAGQIDFKTLDISRDPLAQGYSAHSFDLIVASIVLHATPLMHVTMSNVRKLLKPGGRLVLVELTGLAAASNTIFGTLEGWWMSEDGREDGPLLTVPQWDGLLKRHGFSGTDLSIPAHVGSTSHLSSMIVSKAVIDTSENDGQPKAEMKASVHLGHSDSLQQAAVGYGVSLSLGKRGIACTHRGQDWDMATSTEDSDRLQIVIDSAEHALLLQPTSEMFEQVKQLLLQGKNVLWVSFQESSHPETAALKNMINGTARVVRRENPSLRLITVDVQDQLSLSGNLQRIAETLAEIATSSFWPTAEAVRAEELEYALCDGRLTIPRVVPDERFASFIDSHSNQGGAMVECRYLDKDRPLMFEVQVPGLLNTVRFVDNDEMTAQPLDPDEVEVQACAHGVNFKDVFIALGQMQPGTAMTGEVAGVITAVGSNLQSQWKPGDRVIGLMVAPFGNQVRVKGKGTVAIPDSITFADAASIPVIFYTAWYCLTQVARLESGQSVLIHAASGGVGQAAIQIARLIGAEIYATVGSAAKRKLIQDQYGIPTSHIFSSHTRHFKKGVMRSTRGKGVDVVLNSLSGEFLMDSWDCVAPFGTFLEIGKADIYGRSQLNMANFEKQATFAAVDTSHMYRLRPEFVSKGLAEILDLVDKGLLKPVHPVTTYPMSRIEEAFRLIAARKHVGKLVLVADAQTAVQAPRPKPQPLRLDREGTYVIGGGLGDLGKRMSHFLAERGAGHIVTLSRRRVDARQRASLQESIGKLGGTLHIVQCDIGDEESVRAAAKEIAHLPAVRGVIQSALVLRDHPLEYMSLEDWVTALKPKVRGTLHMHRTFCSPEATDFFVMLSSVASIVGATSQSNYSAGNAFQDAFAHAQRGIGTRTKYATINVGAVAGSEQIARALDQNSEIARIIGAVTFDELFATLEYAMGPQSRLDEAMQCIMPFDRDSMEDAMGETALSDHLFDHVQSRRRLEKASANSVTNGNQPTSAVQAVERAESIQEAEDMVRDGVRDKFAAFIGDDVPVDQPISQLGLDSLVSIEVKNWIKHAFKTPLQTSELSSARSITALSKLIVSRMDLKCKAAGGKPGALDKAESPSPPQNGAPVANGHNGKSDHGLDCCKLSEEVLAQPLPDLDDALDFLLETTGHLYRPEQLATVQQDIQAIKAPNSPARRALQGLFKSHEHDEMSSDWYNHVLSDARWLSKRYPVAPYQSIMVTHRDSVKPQSQAERAAIIASSAFSFKHAMRAGTVEPYWVAGKPTCTSRWDWLYNSVREPRVGCDKMMRYDGCDHIAVLRRGHVFKVMLHEQGGDVPLEQLKATFDAIVAQVQDEGVWTGILTTDERNSWATVRARLSSLSPANAEYFHTIDSALFVLCLDDGCPETPQDRARQGYIGDGSNRWFDKVLQFTVSANGRSGLITEHGAVDGTTPGRLSEWIAAAIDEHSPSQQDSALSHVELEEVVLQTTEEVESHMAALRQRFHGYTSGGAYAREYLTEFGTDFLVEAKVPVKQVVDLTFQLAVRLFFGRNLPSWESISVAHYHQGRSEAVQRAIPAVVVFCDAAAAAYHDQDAGSVAEVPKLAALLSAAAKQMHANMQSQLSGRSHVRVMELLNWLWPSEAAPKPRFLSEGLFIGKPAIYAQSNALEADMVVDDFVSLLPNTEGFWTIMMPEKSSIRLSLTGGSQERIEAFSEQLHRAAKIVRDIIVRAA